jgi:hypothetical protein
MKRWPVTVSYFERPTRVTASRSRSMRFVRAYENGIPARADVDYNNFSISGEPKTLEIKDTKACPCRVWASRAFLRIRHLRA